MPQKPDPGLLPPLRPNAWGANSLRLNATYNARVENQPSPFRLYFWVSSVGNSKLLVDAWPWCNNRRVPGAFQFHMFLSHTARDKPVARLQREGVRVWLDEEQIKPGDSIPTGLTPLAGPAQVA
jgi:hypothetical protein